MLQTTTTVSAGLSARATGAAAQIAFPWRENGRAVFVRLLIAGGALVAAGSAVSAQFAATSPSMSRPPLSAAQFEQIIKIVKPMQKTLAKKPEILSQKQISLSGPVELAPKIVEGWRGTAAEPLAGNVTGERQSDEIDRETSSGVTPNNYGNGKQQTIYHYTDYLVDARLMKTFPYRATGMFLYKQKGNWWYCSGSLISKSILLVAGHCVHAGDGQQASWDTEGYFYPGSTDMNGGPKPTMPYGVASAYKFYTWTGWYKTGALDRGYDIGLVVLNKQNGGSNEIGAVTGHLGFCYGNCLQTYWLLSQIGYPSNYYGGNKMSIGHQLVRSDARDYVFGSGMGNGSSGSPHVANFGALSDTASNKGQYAVRNIVFAPTSWGYTDTSLKIQGASPLTGPKNAFDFAHVLYNAACTDARALHGSGSCTLLP